ncbi:MAG: M14 family metallopeptidase [Patescibacteria group bacterium]
MKIIKAIIVIVVLGACVFLAISFFSRETGVEVLPTPTTLEIPGYKVVGKSVEGRNIESYTFGNGVQHLLFVGGIHGGYEWNSVLLAYEFIDYLKENSTIPGNVTVTIIPSANPDGVYKVIGKEGRFTLADIPKEAPATPGLGRFNAHDVDLNRNFDCKWKPESTWRSQIVSAGTKPFSEPEAVAIRDFVLNNKPEAVIFWHSQANAVYASECNAGILPETLDIMNAYSTAAGYQAIKSFDAYPVSGDAEGWLASINIPAITVELKTHETVEWERNLDGFKAVLGYYGKKIK